METKDIIKALRQCLNTNCVGCPFYDGWYDSSCVRKMDAAAVDEIEKLTDHCARYAEEIAVLKEQVRWIPVEERLPAGPEVE